VLLAAMVRLEHRVRQRINELVDCCRREGATGAEIADALGTSRQAAHERFCRSSARGAGKAG
jgi:hypothetical protein